MSCGYSTNGNIKSVSVVNGTGGKCDEKCALNVVKVALVVIVLSTNVERKLRNLLRNYLKHRCETFVSRHIFFGNFHKKV